MLKMRFLSTCVACFALISMHAVSRADPVIPVITSPSSAAVPRTQPASAPAVVPIAPTVNAKAYLLMDAYSGRILASNNIDERVAPASLTKMMTSYVVSIALKQGRIHLDDLVTVSESAWKTGGSKMFVKVGEKVSVRDLIQGVVVESGNDACVAMAEHVAESQEAFVDLMNRTAAQLGMKGTHFADVSGLPQADHYSTTRDMAILAQRVVLDFPEDYQWYSQKWFSYNGIKQPNRNRLLWRSPDVDGIKTGHTDDAGFCLAASAKKNGMRLIAIVMGAPSDEVRAQDSQKLLNHGFRFFESQKLYSADQRLAATRVLFGNPQQVEVGVARDVYVTLSAGQKESPEVVMDFTPRLKAPLKKGEVVGRVNVVSNGQPVTSADLVALEEVSTGGVWRRLVDHVDLLLRGKQS